ncbi:acetyl-CoA acetyltransferase [Chloroflexota bacterium]
MNPGAIRDKVSIIGMGCTRFGENWYENVDDMIIDAAYEAYDDAGIGPDDIEAAWCGTVFSGARGTFLSQPLKFRNLPITRVENACGTGIEVLRNAVHAVACGVYDVVMAMGAEKLKDSGLSGLPDGEMHPVYGQGGTAPGRWALAATRYFTAKNISTEQAKLALAKIAVKNHHNGALAPKAHFQKEITLEQALSAPIIAWPLGLFDCCPTTDGAACAIICPTSMAKKYRDDYVLIKGFGLAVGPGWGKEDFDYNYEYLPETKAAAKQAYEQAGIKNPREELSLANVHDCFTIAELMEYEALGLTDDPIRDIEEGTFTLEGALPVNPDGGLKAFGHPIAATGLRMNYETYKQIQGKAQLPERQLKDVTLGLSMPQGGHPGRLLPAISILGRRED